MVDGKVVIETELDESGLKKGLAGMASTINKGIMVALGAAATALVTLGKYAIDVGSDFEASMSNVAAISGAVGEEIDALTEKAKEMGAKTKFSASEAADAFSYMAMAGWKTEDMLSGIEGIMNLAAASGEDLASVSDIVTDALTALGMSAADSSHFADVLAAASSNANTNVGLMGETFKYCAAMAGSLGYSSEDLALAIGLMANAGLKGSMAGTSLNTMFTRLSTNTNGARDAIEELGVSFFNVDRSARPLGQVLEELRVKTANMTAEEKANFANKVAGMSAQKGLLAILNASQEDYDKLAGAIATCTDEETGFSAAAQMAATQMDNLQGDLTILKSATEGFGISLYDAMNAVGDGQSMFRDLAQSATELVNELNAAVSEQGLGGLASSVGDVLAKAISKISEYIPKLVDMAIELIQSFVNGIAKAAPTVSKAAIQIGTSLLKGIGSIYSSLVTLAGELIISFCNGLAESAPQIFETMSTALMELLENILDYLPKIAEAGANLLKSLAEGLAQNIPTLLAKALPMLQQLSASIHDNIGIIIDAGIQLIIALVQGLVQALPDLIAYVPTIVSNIANVINDNMPKILQCAFQIMLTIIQGIIENIPNLIANAGKIVKAIVDVIRAMDWLKLGSELLKLFVDGIKALLHLPGEIFRNIVSNIRDSIGNFSWSGLGKSIIDGIVSGIINFGSSIVTHLLSMCSNAFSAVKRFFGIASPSKLFRDEIGENLMLGLAKGIDDEADKAVDAAENAAEKIADVNYDALSDFMKGSVDMNVRNTGSAMSSGNAMAGYGESKDDNTAKDDDKDEQMLEANIYLDKQKVGRIITPVVAKQLEWDGK